MTKQLLAHGVSVGVLSRGDTLGRRLENVESQLTRIPYASLAPNVFRNAMVEFRPDTIFNLGWAGVSNLDRNDVSTQVRNLDLCLELIDVGAASGCQHWIGAGSQAEYGPKLEAISEEDSTHPTTLYGAAKLAAYHLSRTYCGLRNIKHSWLRVFSTYGPDDNENWMIPSLIRQLISGQVPKLTAGEQQWDYLHVSDAARAFVAVAQHRAEGVFNLGSGEAPSLRSTIEHIRDLVSPGAALGFGQVPYRNDQVMRLQARTEKLHQKTCWHPLVPLKDGLRETADWFITHASR
ncbi:MAG: NAD(P)-dependent oxidoreductase [Planctomycetaceae bacterium]|nr:NAD(P)-dependent oxidoreductase [Planctomycetaceae bacterium]